MHTKLVSLLLVCTLFAACATEDVRVTGISRSQAIRIAKNNCREYPDIYSYIDSAEWNSAGHYWVVEITDYRGGRGRIYKINGEGRVIRVQKIGVNGPAPDNRVYYYPDRPYGPYRPNNWWY